MEAHLPGEILRVLEQLPEPRRANTRHKLIDILTIALFAVICGAEDWVAVVAYGRAKQAWLKTFLELPAGIPSHDTFGRVFARLNPEAFERCFLAWIRAGGTLRREAGGHRRQEPAPQLRARLGQGGMAHMVSAFVPANQMVFAQVKTDGKGQELAGIEKLLGLLDLEGAVVTIDALGCQTEIAGQIRAARADYVLQVKDNQPTLHAKVQTLLSEAVLERFAGFRADTHQTGRGPRPDRDPADLGALGGGAPGGPGPGMAGLKEPGPGGTHPGSQRPGQHRAALLHHQSGPPQDRPAVPGLHPRALGVENNCTGNWT